MEIQDMTALEAGRLIRKKELSCKELVCHSLKQIQVLEQKVGAFVTVLEDQALKRAEEVQKQINAGEVMAPLAGVPMGVKDNMCTDYATTTCGSKMLRNFTPPYNATVVERLELSGAIVLGKMNMDEFAMGGSTETSIFGVTKNPWDISRVAGGSSGGSAAAVAAGEVFYTLGSDTGGSIRQPCSFCGVSGIKPTYGAVSRYGLVAYASSLDQIGPVAKDIWDCAEVLSIIGGYDPMDSTSVQRTPMDFSHSFSGEIKGMRIGIPRSYFGEGLDPEVKAPILEAAKTMEMLGAVLVELDMPLVEYAVPAYYVIACAEASSNLSRYDGVRYGYRSGEGDSLSDLFVNTRSQGFGMEVKRRILLGSFVLSSGYFDAYYKKGLQVRGLIQKSFNEAFEQCDMILSPNAPTTAYKIGENSSDPLKMYLGDIYTVSVNLAGLPAVTVPCGFGDNGMPVGLQLIGKPFAEPELVRVAHVFQSSTDYHKKRPVLAGGGEQI